jgi:hypothetical protein
VGYPISHSGRSCWDVPEKLGQLAGTDETKRLLMKEMFIPLKSRQVILEDLVPLMPKLLRLTGKGSRMDLRSPAILKRGPSLLLTRPEEEKAIFQDKSEPPMNLLIAGIKGLKLGQANEESDVDAVRPAVATKEDKAPVKSEGWDKMLYLGLSEHARGGEWARAARTIRPLIARHWRRLQLRKWIRFVKDKRKGLQEVTEVDREAARDCLMRLQATTFWEWESGSRPHFWNYPTDQQITMRDGIILWMKGCMDPYHAAQRLPKDPAFLPKVVEKLCVARDKGCIDLGLVESLISFFEVLKGLTDIRMVCNGTKSSLNEMLWAPWFPLPTVESLL